MSQPIFRARSGPQLWYTLTVAFRQSERLQTWLFPSWASSTILDLTEVDLTISWRRETDNALRRLNSYCTSLPYFSIIRQCILWHTLNRGRSDVFEIRGPTSKNRFNCKVEIFRYTSDGLTVHISLTIQQFLEPPQTCLFWSFPSQLFRFLSVHHVLPIQYCQDCKTVV